MKNLIKVSIILGGITLLMSSCNRGGYGCPYSMSTDVEDAIVENNALEFLKINY